LQLKIHKLYKWYTPGEPAVKNVSFGLEQGECFALLGVTGAGKTSTIKCLTGEEILDGGSLAIGGNDVNSLFGLSAARSLTGYCPQFDAIYEGMTVLEHLELYADIKGVPSTFRDTLV
jgi:ABC-type multidrug transport system ATPase subunit